MTLKFFCMLHLSSLLFCCYQNVSVMMTRNREFNFAVSRYIKRSAAFRFHSAHVERGPIHSAAVFALIRIRASISSSQLVTITSIFPYPALVPAASILKQAPVYPLNGQGCFIPVTCKGHICLAESESFTDSRVTLILALNQCIVRTVGADKRTPVAFRTSFGWPDQLPSYLLMLITATPH